MRTKAILLLFILLAGLLLSSGLVSAQDELEAKAGDYIALRFDKVAVTTTGWPFIGQWTKGWEPAYVKWYLIDPYGKIVCMSECSLSSVDRLDPAIYIGRDSKWEISADGGLLRLPAFAASGMWVVRAKIYDVNKLGFIQWSNTNSQDIAPVYVRESSFSESLSAPLYLYIDLGSNILLGSMEYCITFPDLIFLIAILVVIIIIILNIIAFVRRRRKK
jgi:hypothetical protein